MIDYTLRELECFHAVAEELNFTRAAERLHLSQPPLSRHVRELEKRLGVRLFDRDRRGTALTADGRLFRAETRGVLEQLTRAQQRLRDHAAGAETRLEIAFVGALLSDSMVETLRAYQHQKPEVRLTLHDCTPSDQLDALARGQIDIGFIGPAPREIPRGVETREWRTETLHALVPQGHEWIDRKRIEFSELAGRSLVTVSSEAAPAFGQWLQEVFVSEGVSPLIVQRADRARAVCCMAVVGGVVGLMIESACHPMSGSRPIPICRRGKRVKLTMVLAYRPAVQEHAAGLVGNPQKEEGRES